MRVAMMHMARRNGSVRRLLATRLREDASTSAYVLHRRALVSAFSSSSQSSEPRDPYKGGGSRGVMPWQSVLSRGVGILMRVWTEWPQLLQYYESGVFARRSSNDARSRMFVLTRMPQAASVDLLEFMEGAKQAVHMVYDELYAEAAYPAVHDDRLRAIATEDVLSIFRRKPRAHVQQLALHAEPRTTRLVLERLDIDHIGLTEVTYRSTRLSREQSKERGYNDEEWLRLTVACEVIEHVRVSSAGALAAIEDHNTFQTAFTWTYESNVSKPEEIEWTIVHASEFEQASTLVRANPRP